MYSRLQAVYQYLLQAQSVRSVDLMWDVHHNNNSAPPTNQPQSVSTRVIFKWWLQVCDRL
jgi:hypothetical protein